ncbi:MAG: hypothetical protein GXP31_15270 [Kiritimatiellaeota bacterium]|nr:hypothetical protein [Kiritimatiellota bacterium]
MNAVWSRPDPDCLRMALALLGAVAGVVGVRADYAGEVASHVQSVGIYKGYTHSPGASTPTVQVEADVEIETDVTVNSIIVQPPPPAAAFLLEQERRRGPVRQGRTAWGWERHGTAALDALPDGDYTVTFTFTDGSSGAVSVPFSRENGTPLQFPDQVPSLNGATAEKLIVGGPDVTFSWIACTDPKATGVHFGIDTDFGILETDPEILRSLQEDTEALHRFDPSPDLPAGVFDAALAFADFRAGETAEGIGFKVAKYREQVYWLVVSQPDADLQQNLLGVNLFLGAGTARRSDALDFHAQIRTSAQVETVAMRVPNYRADENELRGWQWTTEADGSKTWTFDRTFASLQDFLDQSGFGPYGVYVQWSDGYSAVSRLTHVYFSAADESGAPLEIPQQTPNFLAPDPGAFLPSPVMFQWDAWDPTDPTYSSDLAGIRLTVGPTLDPQGSVDQFLDKTACVYGPQTFSNGNYRAALYFAQERQSVTGDGIPFFGAAFRTATRDFSVGQTGRLQVHIEPAASHALGVGWSIDNGVSWHAPDATVSLPPGDYNVVFNGPNWNLRPPADLPVTVTADTLTEQTATYEKTVRTLNLALLVENDRNTVDFWAETAPDVVAVRLQTANGKIVDLAPDNGGQRTETVDWRYAGKNLTDFSEYGDGLWTVFFTIADQSEHAVNVLFAHADGPSLQLAARAPQLSQPATAHGRARMMGPDLTFQWTPYTGADANMVHIEIDSRGRNNFEQDRWTELERKFEAEIGAGAGADPGACTFLGVPGGVYWAGFYFGDGEKDVTPELIETFVAKGRGSIFEILVVEPVEPLQDVLAEVRIRRLKLTSVNGSESGLFRAEVAPAVGANIAALQLRPPEPADEWLALDWNGQSGTWNAQVTGTAADVAQRFPGGFYDLEVRYNDGRSLVCRTLGVEAVRDDLADLPDVAQTPELTAPVGQTTAPVDFAWAPCTDPVVTGIVFRVRTTGETEWQGERALTATSVGTSGMPLAPSAYVGRLVFLNQHAYNVSRGIAADVAFGRAVDFPFTVAGAVSTLDAEFELRPGWNLISLPLSPYPETDPEVIFAGVKQGPVWTWNAQLQTFEIATVLEGKRGYWICGPGTRAAHVAVSGTVLPDGIVRLAHAWNLVGAILGAGAQVDVPPGRSTWGWDGRQYRPANVLDYAKGYWMYCPIPGGEDVNLGDRRSTHP